MGHSTSCFFLPSCGEFSASFILLLNSSRVSSRSSKPAGGGLRLRAVRTGGMVRATERDWICAMVQRHEERYETREIGSEEVGWNWGRKARKRGIADRPRHFCARRHRLRFCGRSFLYLFALLITSSSPSSIPCHTPWTLNPSSSSPSSMKPTRRSLTRSCKASPRSRPSSRVSIPQGRGEKRRFPQFKLQWAPANPLLLSAVVHQLNDTCWKKCVTGKISTASLAKSEETCAQNCVERWMDTQVSILKQLETMRAH